MFTGTGLMAFIRQPMTLADGQQISFWNFGAATVRNTGSSAGRNPTFSGQTVSP
jgi:hypothetical protein